AKPFLERWMNQQVGWQGLVERLQREAPRYAQLLPELPRLLHQALQGPGQAAAQAAALQALVAEQRHTNRLLQSLLFGAIGFVGGVLAVVWLAWRH
ncbi:MAG TPA: ubiquinone biosynthesis regulatory protein kinase UbiB, partial [Rubrivivax sp.]|nr:ubiquinone biosynthesis regulatory protein kinase UbiB [Rubrivivax sp.]